MTTTYTPRTITPAQVNLIYRLGWKAGLDYDALCRQRYGKEVSQLTIGQASQYIDWLKRQL